MVKNNNKKIKKISNIYMSFVWMWPAQNKEDTVRECVDGTLPAVVYTK